MATVTFNVPNPIAQELNQIAQDNGFANAKAMVIAYLKATIKASRVSKLNIEQIREDAEKQADKDTAID